MPVYTPKGLTSNDRSSSDKKIITQQSGVSVQSGTLPSFEIHETGLSPVSAQEYDDTLSSRFQEDRIRRAENYFLGEDDNNITYATENDRIKKIARTVSPHFQKYENTDKVKLSPKDWTNLYLDYESRKEVYGEYNANIWLAGELQDHIAGNQSVFEKAYNGFAGLGASAAGAAVGLVGNLVGLGNYLIGNHEDIEGLNWFGNMLDSIMDNDISRYGNDIVTYGTWKKDRIDSIKNGSGISDLAILETRDQENTIFDINTLPTALQNGGFTVLSMLTGAGMAKGAQLMFRGIKGATLAAKGAKTVEDISKARNALRGIQNAERVTNAFVIPALVGTTEGLMEGLNTKLQFLEDSKNYISDYTNERVNSRAAEIKALNPSLTDEEAYNQALNFILNDPDEVSKYNDVLSQSEYDAVRAGVNNFWANSLINGVLNMTLKAGLQAPRVQTALQKSRLTSWATPKGKFGVNAAGEVTPKYGLGKQVWNIFKEPLGEFTEEYLQTLSDEAARGGAENNLHAFIENKYNGDSMAEIGDYMSGDFAAAFTALKDAATSKEAIESGVYGAISSILGTPAVRTRDYTRQERGTDGKYHTKLDFGRREDENFLSHITRLMPWRSGLVQSIRETNTERRELQEEANILNEWIKDPDHRDKFDGIVGTWSWAKQMQESGDRGDEFGYRNSVLGKTINDAMMLEKLRGTEYYNSFMKELSEASQLEEGTPEAAKYIAALRDNVEVDTNNRSDSELVEDLRNNAQMLLETMTKIQEESDVIDRTLGPIDEDTKQALIYGQMAIEDWENRGNKLNSEVREATSGIENTSEGTQLNNVQRKAIAKYGTLQRAEKEIAKLRERAASLTKIIQSNEKTKKNLTEEAKTRLKTNKAQLKAINKYLKQFEGLEIDQENPTVLNEEQIMALDPSSRGAMLDPENLSKFSQAQQDVINNLINRATSKDRNFTNKVVDAGRIASEAQKFYEQYAEISKDPQSFNRYTQRAKQAAADALTAKRFESLNSIQDYNAFATELDNIFDNSSYREQALIMSALSRSNNPMFERYTSDREELKKLMDQIVKDENFEKLEDNDRALFAAGLTFLKNRGVDINNLEDVISAFSTFDDNGKTAFENYVDKVNTPLSEDNKLVFTSPGEVIQTFKDVMNAYRRDLAETERNEREIIPSDDVTPEDSTPAPRVEAPPKGEVKEEEKVEEDKKEDKDSKDSVDDVADSVIEVINENDKPIVDAMNRATKAVQKSSVSDDIKAEAMAVLAELGEADYEYPQDLARAIIAQANRILAESEDGTSPVASLLTRAAMQAEKEDTPTIVNIFKDNVRQATSPESFAFGRPTNNPNAGIIDALDHTEMRKWFPNSPIVRFLDRYGVDDYLRSDKLRRDTKIYFVSPSDYAQETKTQLESEGKHYNLDNEVLVAVVEEENGPMTIDGKNYQPIGIMPRTSSQRNNGSARLGEVRKLAQKTGYDKIVTDKQGNPVTTTLGEPVHAKAPKHLSQSEPNNSAQTIQMNDLSKEEREQLQRMSPEERRKSPIYERMKRNFLEHFRVSKRSNSTPYLSYVVSNLKGETIPIEAFVTPLQRTRDINKGRLISELFNSGDVSGILNANSRLRRASKEMAKFFETFRDDIMVLRTDNGLIPAGESVEILEKASTEFSKIMSNYFTLPAKEGWKYKFTPLEEMISEEDNSRRLFNLSIENSDGREINLGKVTRGQITPQTQFDILKNLIMDGSSVRMRNNKDSFVIWQVNYSDVGNDATMAKANMSDIYDDDIIDFSKDSFKYNIMGVSINAPFNIEGKPSYRAETNTSNTKTQPVVSKPTGYGEVKRGNATIDTDTGAVVEGKAQEEKRESKEEVKQGARMRDRRVRKAPSKPVETKPEYQWGKFIGRATDSQAEYTEEMKGILKNAPRNTEGKLLAPNGKPSNLNERQYAYVRTKAFKEWFGDWENDYENSSKVLDENGEPLVMYHHSHAIFNQFSYDFVSDPESGFYFSSDEEYSKQFGNNRYAVFLNIRNPIDAGDIKLHRNNIFSITMNYKGDISKIDGIIGNDQLDDNLVPSMGFEAMVYNSTQIKFATDNIGTYDKNDPNIPKSTIGNMTSSEIQQALEAKGYTEETWNMLSEEMKEHELDCCGA